jgi:hypothetical protein
MLVGMIAEASGPAKRVVMKDLMFWNFKVKL